MLRQWVGPSLEEMKLSGIKNPDTPNEWNFGFLIGRFCNMLSVCLESYWGRELLKQSTLNFAMIFCAEAIYRNSTYFKTKNDSFLSLLAPC